MLCIFRANMRSLLYTTLLLVAHVASEESSEYLESAIKGLKGMGAQVDTSQRKIDNMHAEVPALSLAKEELAKLYEDALRKGDTLRISTGDGPQLNAAMYEWKDEDMEHSPDDSSSYYYYYYPLKAFMDELTSQRTAPVPHTHVEKEVPATGTFHQETVHLEPPHHQYHTHTHQHKIHIIQGNHSLQEKRPKPLEPLFMAISGFIGMSVMFVLSMLILPKLGGLKSRGVKDSAEVTSILKIIYQAIEGEDCSERLACEFGKATRAFNIHNNRIFKLLRRIGPTTLSKRLYSINKYSNNKYKCGLIQCKVHVPKSKARPPNKKGK